MVEDKTGGLKKILFLCVGNTCRSQMAEGFGRFYGKGRVQVRSAGTAACGFVNPVTIEMMREKDIDISGQSSDQLTDEMVEWSDMVVTLGCCAADMVCPANYMGGKVDWPIDDPLGMGQEFFRRVRDDIEERVRRLIETGKE